DFMLTGRPSVSFAYDLAHYAGTERGLFYDLEHVFPGPVCRDFAALCTVLERFGDGRLEPPADLDLRRRTFFDHLDDGSAWRVVGRVRALALEGATPMVRC
ncbi:CDP-glycerol glycerophosphotransferase family protein, partial [Luteimonas wenzhouensis]